MRITLLFFFTLLFSRLLCHGQSSEFTTIKKSLTQISDSLRYVDALNRLATLLYEKNIDSTFYYTTQAREIADRLQYDKGKADALNNLGIFFDIKGNLQLALRYYNEAYAGYTRLQDSANRVQTLMNIAMVYKEIGKDQRAIQRFNAALDLGEKLSKDSIMSLAIYNYLLQYPAQFSRDSLSYYINKAKHIAKKYKDERTLLAIEQLIADDLISYGKTKEGLDLLNRTITIAINEKFYYASMDMLIDMGDQLISTDPSQAAGYYEQGLNIANKNGYLIYSQILARKLFDLYTTIRDHTKASRFSRLLITLHDEQEKLDSKSGIDYLDYALKDQQVKSLVVRSKYQAALLLLAALACLLAIIVIIVIRQNLKRTKRINELITTQNADMQKALTALEQSQEENTRIMKIVAHDLRSPMAATISITSMLLENDNLLPEDKEMLELMKTSSLHSLEMISDLLNMNTTATGLKKEPVEVHTLLRYCVDLLKFKANDKKQEITLKTQEIVAKVNREKIWRVISNLIVNAIKFSPEGSLIRVEMHQEQEAVLIAIKDNGIGIPENLKDKIFQMFTDARRTGTSGEQSFGLGLAISRQIVEAHGGQIWFESNLNGGTVFYIKLPISQD